MKKIVLLISGILLLVGCDMMNSPTKVVEKFLNKYQTVDEEIVTQLDETLTKENTLNDELKEAYKEIMKNQYQNLYYTIKDERIDGNHATVTVEIEVYNYSKSIKDADDYLIGNEKEFLNDEGNIDNSKFMTYKLKQMKNTKDKIKYTLDFNLTKINEKWVLDDIDEITRQKIHGIYVE